MEKEKAEEIVTRALALFGAYEALTEGAEETEEAGAVRGTLEKFLDREIGEESRIPLVARFVSNRGRKADRALFVNFVADALAARDAKELGAIQARIEDLLKGGNGPEGEAELEEILEAARRGGYRPR